MYFWNKKEDLYFGSVSVMNNFSTVASIFQPFANLSMVSSKLHSLYILVQYSTQLDLLVLFHSHLTEKYLQILSLKISLPQNNDLNSSGYIFQRFIKIIPHNTFQEFQDCFWFCSCGTYPQMFLCQTCSLNYLQHKINHGFLLYYILGKKTHLRNLFSSTKDRNKINKK